MTSSARALRSYLHTRWHTRKGQKRAAFKSWQQQQLEHWLTHDLPKVAAYDAPPKTLTDLPILEKADVMSRFEDFTLGQITAADGWAAFESTGKIGDVSIGASTGTSGNRALYAITDEERMDWLGSILAKALPGFWHRRERIAIILPQNSSLYDGANDTQLMRLRFFDLNDGVEAWLEALETFSPTTIVAPPRVLRHLVETGAQLTPNRVYSGGETLDPNDQALIESHFGLTLGQIYMATEGLFAVSCEHGHMHLTEDANFFELEPAGEGLFSPIITSFRRRYQIMARYRMNDLLRIDETPCACGSPLLVVSEIVGRMDDAFEMNGRLITPDVLRNAVLDAARDIEDFRLVRSDEKTLDLTLPEEVSGAAAALAQGAVEGALRARGLPCDVNVKRANLCLETDRKLRRVENRWRG